MILVKRMRFIGSGEYKVLETLMYQSACDPFFTSAWANAVQLVKMTMEAIDVEARASDRSVRDCSRSISVAREWIE